ncbi:polysaccharide deacetylase family protein [Candidatus Acetothermia bacterium]|nr:polysaccharide deacetylase family protein [Candidatus Acetothermia bacterium]
MTALVTITGITLSLAGLWTILPDLWFHRLRRQVLWHGPRDVNRVALTFDDGPHPVDTPRTLEVLARHNIQATFFLVGKHADRYPNLVREIATGGHDIGNHTYNHRHQWSLGPVKTVQEIRQGKEALEQIIGKPIEYFRPPWGIFNLRTFSAGRTNRGEVVLWSCNAPDYKLIDPAAIAHHVAMNSSAGSIILLHDANSVFGTSAPMLTALPLIITNLKQRGLNPVPLRQLKRSKVK